MGRSYGTQPILAFYDNRIKIRATTFCVPTELQKHCWFYLALKSRRLKYVL